MNGFALIDIFVEYVLRQGFQYIRTNPYILKTDIFYRLANIPKYGEKEVNRIIQYFTENEVSIVTAFPNNIDNLPCISLQLLSDQESIQHTGLSDYVSMDQDTFKYPYKKPAIILNDITPVNYDPISGFLNFPNNTDFSAVNPFQLYIDNVGNSFTINGVSSSSQYAQLLLEPNLITPPSISGPGVIQSSVDYSQFIRRMTITKESVLLGVHTQDRLLTIYLYTLVKYFMLSRKTDLINLGLVNPTFEGSDFTRDLQYTEPIFSRFFTVSSILEHTWQSTPVTPVEVVTVAEQVQQDIASTDEIPNLSGTSITVGKNS